MTNMTFDELCDLQEDIIHAHQEGFLTESQLEREMEMLQELYEEECEDY